MSETLKNHFKRRAVVIAERVELELTVAGTEYAPLERAVFKATKNNTKTPKEKHVAFLKEAIADGDQSSKTVLKMLARRLKEVGSNAVNSASLAAGVKTLAVWHRCLNSGDSSFIQLCAQYAHVVEPPSSNPLGLLYGAYLREMLACYNKCKHAYHREAVPGACNVDTLNVEDLLVHAKCILAQLLKLVECDLQGGLIDAKTRMSVQYIINLLMLDAHPLFAALGKAAERIKGIIGRLSAPQAEQMERLYLQFSKLPAKLSRMLQQVSFDRDASPPVPAFSRKYFSDFEALLKETEKRLSTEDSSYETVKALAQVAVAENGGESRLNEEDELVPSVARISLAEVEADQQPNQNQNKARGGASGAPAAAEVATTLASLIDLDDTDFSQPEKPPPVSAVPSGELWDPFGNASTPALSAAPAAAACKPAVNPFDDPFASAPPAAGGTGAGQDLLDFGGAGGGGGAGAGQKANLLDSNVLSSLYAMGPQTQMYSNQSNHGGGGMGGGMMSVPGNMGLGGMGMNKMGGMGMGMGMGGMGMGMGTNNMQGNMGIAGGGIQSMQGTMGVGGGGAGGGLYPAGMATMPAMNAMPAAPPQQASNPFG